MKKTRREEVVMKHPITKKRVKTKSELRLETEALDKEATPKNTVLTVSRTKNLSLPNSPSTKNRDMKTK